MKGSKGQEISKANYFETPLIAQKANNFFEGFFCPTLENESNKKRNTNYHTN